MTAPRATIGNSHINVLPLNLDGNVFRWTADRDSSFAVLNAFTAVGGIFLTPPTFQETLPAKASAASASG